MSDKKKKSSVWLYAVILFFSAFIVLVFAGYSQIRLNKSLESYKSQVFNTESEREMYQQHFASAQEMNEELNKEIDDLKMQVDSLSQEIKALEESNADLESKLQTAEAHEVKLSNAMKLFLDGRAAECVDFIKTIDTEHMKKDTLAMLDTLRQKASAQAGELLYDEGYELYSEKKYAEAISAFELSFKYAPEGEFSDKCLYYLSYSELKAGDKEKAVDNMVLLTVKFPESKYISKAKSFIKQYQE